MEQEQPPTKPKFSWARDVLAISVFGVSALGILLIAVLVISGTGTDPNKDKVFSALVPLFGTWVGTILAFYFSRENFESASESLKTAYELTGEQRLRQIPAAKVMLPVAKIKGITLESGKTEKDYPLSAMLDMLVHPVTRVPVLEVNGAAKYVIHQSMLYKYVTEKTRELKTAFNLDQATLADFVEQPGMRDMITRLAFVSSGEMLAAAKEKMEALGNCQDVFVTETGAASEPVIGWLTNIDIQKQSRAS